MWRDDATLLDLVWNTVDEDLLPVVKRLEGLAPRRDP